MGEDGGRRARSCAGLSGRQADRQTPPRSPAAVTGDAGSMCTMEVVHLMKVAHIQIVQTVVTFEFPTRAPVTFRSTVAGWRASTCASRAMEHAAAALHPVGWTSAVVVLLARETANITEGGPRTRGSLPPSLSTTTPNPLACAAPHAPPLTISATSKEEINMPIFGKFIEHRYALCPAGLASGRPGGRGRSGLQGNPIRPRSTNCLFAWQIARRGRRDGPPVST